VSYTQMKSLAKLEALRRKIVGVEEAKDVEACREAERGFREGKLVPFERE